MGPLRTPLRTSRWLCRMYVCMCVCVCVVCARPCACLNGIMVACSLDVKDQAFWEYSIDDLATDVATVSVI
jgi:hypothetical protein